MAALYEHKRGRRKHYLDFEEARKWVRAEELGSKRQYFSWWRHSFYRVKKPPLPCRCDLVYSEQWIDWNDFLGTDNRFGGGENFHKYLRFSEALAYARSLNLKRVREWREMKHPPNVPKWPHIAYRGKFISYKHWLGKTTLSKIQAEETFKENRLLVIGRIRYNPANRLYVYIEPDGFPGLRKRWEQLELELLRVFYYEDGYRWETVMDAFGVRHNKHQWTVWNVAGLLFKIDLDAVPPEEMRARLLDQYPEET